MLLAMERFPQQGLNASGLLFGATDMDAITLSVARDGSLPDAERAHAVLLATCSNTVMKYALVFVFGDRSLLRSVGVGFGAIFVVTVLALLFT